MAKRAKSKESVFLFRGLMSIQLFFFFFLFFLSIHILGLILFSRNMEIINICYGPRDLP